MKDLFKDIYHRLTDHPATTIIGAIGFFFLLYMIKTGMPVENITIVSGMVVSLLLAKDK